MDCVLKGYGQKISATARNILAIFAPRKLKAKTFSLLASSEVKLLKCYSLQQKAILMVLMKTVIQLFIP